MQFQINPYLRFHLKKLKRNEGFTLVELLVVVIVIGILSAIALPNLMAQTGKARETEAKNNLSILGRAQQAYFFQRGTFADSLAKLEVTFQTNYYNFSEPSLVSANVVKHQATSNSPNPAVTNTRNYGLGVYYNTDSTFNVTLCQSSIPGGGAEAPNMSTGSCTSGDRIQ